MKYIRVILSALLLTLTAAATDAVAADKVRVAVLPWQVNAAVDAAYLEKATYDMLTSRVGSAASVELVGRSEIKAAVSSAALSNDDMTDEAAASLGRDVNADYVLYGSLSIIGNSVSLDAKLVSVSDGTVTPFFSSAGGLEGLVSMTGSVASRTVGVVTGGAEGIVSGEVGYRAPTATLLSPVDKGAREAASEDDLARDDGVFVRSALSGGKRKALWKSDDIDTDTFLRGFVVADLDGDGAGEMVFISEKDVIIASLEEGKLKVLKKIEGSGDEQYLYLSKMKGEDGRTVVYLSRIKNGAAASRTLEYRSKRYVLGKDSMKWLVRAVDIDGTGPRLVGRTFSRFRGLGSHIRLLRRDGGSVVDEGRLDVPRKFALYGFTYGDFDGDGVNEMIGLDDDNKLRVYRKKGKKWKAIWKGKEFYGGSLNILELKRNEISADKTSIMVVNGRLLIDDFDGDGSSELLIRKNHAKGFLGERAERIFAFDSGVVVNFGWEGRDVLSIGEFTERWRTREVKGYISDFNFSDVDGDGRKELVMLIVEDLEKKEKARNYIVTFGASR